MGDVEGFLLKQGVGPLLGKRYKKRWFKLIGKQMHYYKARHEVDSIGYIDLGTATGVRKNDDFTDGKPHFQIETPGRAWQLIAENTEDLQRWVYAINNAINPDRSSSVPQVRDTPAQGSTGAVPSESVAPAAAPATMAPSGPEFSLAMVKSHAKFLQEGNQVTEFWQMYSDSVNELPSKEENEYQVVVTADMEKVTWRTLGQQSRCIQPMVDFFWSVGAPELELDRLNSVGTLINPLIVGYWVTVSSKLGIDGGWFFPAEIGTEIMEAAVDESPFRDSLREWLVERNVAVVQTVSRDMGAQPPRQSEVSIDLPGATVADQLAAAQSAFERFGFDPLPEDVVQYVQTFPHAHLKLFINVTFEGFVKMSLLLPYPPVADLDKLFAFAGLSTAKAQSFRSLQDSLGATAAYVEFLHLKQGFGYGVYKEGFDVAFHMHSTVDSAGWLKLGAFHPEYLSLMPDEVCDTLESVIGSGEPTAEQLEQCSSILAEHQKRVQ